MSSFYGGRDGRPFIISHAYETVKDMVDNNGDLTNFPIGEYCIINTNDFNHPDNGKIFRRDFPYGKTITYNIQTKSEAKVGEEVVASGYTYKESNIDSNGMVLIGQIVGPSGPAAKIGLDKYEIIEDLKVNEDFTKFKKQGALSLEDGDILNPEDNHEILWTSCSIRDIDNQDATCYIGLKIPYTSVLFTAESETPYYNRDKTDDADFTNTNLITRPSVEEGRYGETSDGKTNPFIQNWNIKIPKGIHGVSVENVRVIDATNKVEEITGRDDKGHITTQPYSGREDDITNKRKILVCDIVDYDWNKDGDRHTIYLGDYNMINKISIADNGTVTIDYSHDSSNVWNQRLNWLTSIGLTDEGKFTVTTNNNNLTDITKDLTWIKEFQYEKEQGLLKITLNNNAHGSQNTSINVKTPNSLYTKEDGAFEVEYNTGEKKTLGRFYFQGGDENTAASALSVGGLWIETIEVGE